MVKAEQTAEQLDYVGGQSGRRENLAEADTGVEEIAGPQLGLRKQPKPAGDLFETFQAAGAGKEEMQRFEEMRQY